MHKICFILLAFLSACTQKSGGFIDNNVENGALLFSSSQINLTKEEQNKPNFTKELILDDENTLIIKGKF